MIDCRLHVNGTPFADSAADLEEGAPTALADAEVTWGRSTTVDQPDAATARIVVEDRSGTTAFRDQLPIGAPVDLWAAGDISTGSPVDIAVDGSFEAVPLGDAFPRVSAEEGQVYAVSAPTHTGGRAVQMTNTGTSSRRVAYFPPAAFVPGGDPAAWDHIPRLNAGDTWESVLWIRAGIDASVIVEQRYFQSPQDLTGTTLPIRTDYVSDGTWQATRQTITVPVAADNAWLGLRVTVILARWAYISQTQTWTETPGSWVDYWDAYTDDLELWAPASGLIRDVLIFSGRISDLTAERVLGDQPAWRVQVTAVDQLADLQNRYVGDEPWPMEALSARLSRVATLSGAEVELRLDPALAGLQVGRRDVDQQPAGGLMAELAAGVDGVLWSATHATTGPYIWLEDVALRAQLGVLEEVGGVVVITVATSNRPEGRTILDGCDLPAGEATWVRDVTDVITRVDATWQDQSTSPDPTERNIRVLDTAAEQAYGVRRAGMSTPLTSAADATDAATRVLNRSRDPAWRVEGLIYDLGLAPPAAGTETAAALDLLDGSTRLGRGVVVSDVELWPGRAVGGYLDGGRYAFTGAWMLGLVLTPMAGMSHSGPWTSLDPAWVWTQFDPAIGWVDLLAVTGPVTELEAA